MQGDLGVAGQAKRKRPSFRQLIPNFVTIFVIGLGLTAVRFGMDEKFGRALLLIVLAAFLDAADGRIARYLDSVTAIGAELDSLADFFNFGIAPGLLIYMALFWGTEQANLGWFAVLALSVCCALRLARFNVALDDTSLPSWKAKYFVGVPAPVVGCLALLPMFLLMLGYEEVKEYPRTIFVYLVIVGLLAVSTLPTFSMKHIRIKPENLLFVVVGCAAAIASLMVFTWQTLIAADILYILTLPISFRVYRRRLKGETPES